MIYVFINPLLLSGPLESAPFPTALLQDAEWIPVTGLGEEDLLHLPAAFTSWQILYHGAVVLTPEGEEDPAWSRLTVETQRASEQALTLVYQAATHIGELRQLGTEAELLTRHGLPLLVKVTHPYELRQGTEEAARELAEWIRESPFRGQLSVVWEGETLTVLPSELGKASAVNYVLSRLGSDTELTIGASGVPDDRAYLSLCDYALVPGENVTEVTLTGTDDED